MHMWVVIKEDELIDQTKEFIYILFIYFLFYFIYTN